MLNKKQTLFVASSWTLLVTVLSLISTGSFVSIANINIAYKDKIVHFIFYFVMVILWLNYYNRTTSKNSYIKVLFMTICYGILIEICQGVFTANREADVFDAIVNTVGAFSGFILFKALSNKN
ncbi:VanZ family protein [Flavobacterium sp.]|uniref:VanZ family protein n=1 Tax=Flavobacterium sp. TaxID=239 RepID=UPI0037BE5783